MNYTIFCMNHVTAVKNLKKHKSTGINDITGETIQTVGEKVTEDAICNQIWKAGNTRGMDKISHFTLLK